MLKGFPDDGTIRQSLRSFPYSYLTVWIDFEGPLVVTLALRIRGAPSENPYSNFTVESPWDIPLITRALI